MRIDKFCEELMKKPDDIRQDSDSMSRELSDDDLAEADRQARKVKEETE